VTDEVLGPTSIAAPTSATIALTPVSANSSSLASVVSKRGLMWDLADDDLPVTLFHKKFWGKSMKDEESEWRKSQMMIDQPEDMYDDERDDDIISGCYALDLNIPRMLVTSLWVRADYIRIFDHFQAFYDEYASPMEITPCGVLSGQPGIGESSCIASSAGAQVRSVRQECLDLLRRSSLRSGNETIHLVLSIDMLPVCE